MVKRQTNVYRVIEPAESEHKNGAGIYQDGSDFSYFVRAKLGSEEKELYMLLDTGAATSWVMGTECVSPACEKHNNFGSQDSDTLEVLDGDGFSVNYGTGSVKGNRVKDTIAVAGLKPELVFGLANETSNDFNHFPFDGILGLSMASGSSDNFLKKIKALDVLDKNIFCVFINRASDGPNTGEITFGQCNEDKYTGDFTYTDVKATNGDWAIPMDGLTYDGKKAGVKGKLAYIDTGTSYVFGPQSDVEAFHKHIPGSSSSDGTTWKVPCDSNKEVTYQFSGQSYTIKTSDWVSKPDKDGNCTSNIYGHEVVPGAWLLGDLFLKNVYAVFDVDEERIGKIPQQTWRDSRTDLSLGFANRAATPEPDSSSDGDDGSTGEDQNKEDGDHVSTTSGQASTTTSASSAENGSATTTGTPQSVQQSTTTEPTPLITQSTPTSPTGIASPDVSGEDTNPSATSEEASQETDDDASLGSHTRTPSIISAALCIFALTVMT